MAEIKLGDALKNFLDKSRLKSGVTALKIDNVWEQIMGKTIANYTDKLEIIGETLFVNTAVGPLKQELAFQKDKIIERVNEAMGERVIKSVIIQ
jgi:hypothetical protein